MHFAAVQPGRECSYSLFLIWFLSRSVARRQWSSGVRNFRASGEIAYNKKSLPAPAPTASAVPCCTNTGMSGKTAEPAEPAEPA